MSLLVTGARAVPCKNDDREAVTIETRRENVGPCSRAGGPGRGSVPPSPCYSSEDLISCQLTRSVQCAHQKPITVLRAAAGRVVTGSQDHTVRVTKRRTTALRTCSDLVFPSVMFTYESCVFCSGLPAGGLVLPVHSAGSLWRDHSHLY